MKPSDETETPIPKKPVFLSVVLIIILGFAVYGNSLNNEFFWDDEVLIENNEYIKQWTHIPQIFTKDIGAGSRKQYAFYRPLQIISYMVDYSLWGLNVKGYHLTNIVLHVLVALLIYCLINIIFHNNLLSLLTGSFFVVHPVHSEAVAYISGRSDPLALFFMLLCFIFYLKNSSPKGVGVFMVMMLSYAFALLSRENSLILPVLILIYHYSFKKKMMIGRFISIFILAVIYIFLRVTVLGALLTTNTSPATLLERLPGFFVAIAAYMRLLIFPFHLHMEYGSGLFHWGNPKTTLGMILFFVLLVYAFKQRRHEGTVFFSITWFFVALLPVSNLYPINAYMAEHWLYVPSIGFFLMAAKAITSLFAIKDFRIFVTVFMIALLAFYSSLTIRQNVFWGEPLNFFERTLQYVPHNPRVYYNLSNVYKSMNRMEESIVAYQKAIEINPDYTEAHNNLGTVYAALHRYEEAAASYQKAIEIDADFTEAYNNLGIAYKAVKNNDGAIVAYKQAIAIDSEYAEAYFNLGNIYAEMDNNNEAVAAYTKATEFRTDFAKAYHNLGNVYRALKKSEEAIASYKKAIAVDPRYALAYNHLALIYFQEKQYQMAIEHLEKAQELGFTNTALFEALKPFR